MPAPWCVHVLRRRALYAQTVDFRAACYCSEQPAADQPASRFLLLVSMLCVRRRLCCVRAMLQSQCAQALGFWMVGRLWGRSQTVSMQMRSEVAGTGRVRRIMLVSM